MAGSKTTANPIRPFINLPSPRILKESLKNHQRILKDWHLGFFEILSARIHRMPKILTMLKDIFERIPQRILENPFRDPPQGFLRFGILWDSFITECLTMLKDLFERIPERILEESSRNPFRDHHNDSWHMGFFEILSARILQQQNP